MLLSDSGNRAVSLTYLAVLRLHCAMLDLSLQRMDPSYAARAQ